MIPISYLINFKNAYIYKIDEEKKDSDIDNIYIYTFLKKINKNDETTKNIILYINDSNVDEVNENVKKLSEDKKIFLFGDVTNLGNNFLSKININGLIFYCPKLTEIGDNFLVMATITQQLIFQFKELKTIGINCLVTTQIDSITFNCHHLTTIGNLFLWNAKIKKIYVINNDVIKKKLNSLNIPFNEYNDEVKQGGKYFNKYLKYKNKYLQAKYKKIKNL
jgi:hypothetical protein